MLSASHAGVGGEREFSAAVFTPRRVLDRFFFFFFLTFFCVSEHSPLTLL